MEQEQQLFYLYYQLQIVFSLSLNSICKFNEKSNSWQYPGFTLAKAHTHMIFFAPAFHYYGIAIVNELTLAAIVHFNGIGPAPGKLQHRTKLVFLRPAYGTRCHHVSHI